MRSPALLAWELKKKNCYKVKEKKTIVQWHYSRDKQHNS